jgi:thymidylate synthase
MRQYLNLCNRVAQEGKWIENERTGKRCLTVINADLQYNVGKGEFPLVTTRKCFYKSAIAEMIGYLRGYDNAADFRKLGTPTWDMNANDNEAWLVNPVRKGTDDMGFVYGKVARNYPIVGGGKLDLLRKIIDDLSKGYDDRGEILTFYHPGSFHLGCLRPCMYEHQFSLLDGTLYLNSTQRSCDVPLGLTFNMPQVYVLLALIAQITGNQAGIAYHKIINAHIYENQLDQLVNIQRHREPRPSPKLIINPDIKTLEDLETWVTMDDFEIEGYDPHPAIKYPFSV